MAGVRRLVRKVRALRKPKGQKASGLRRFAEGFRGPHDDQFPLGPAVLAFALNSLGSIQNTTGPALRDLVGRELQDRGGQAAARLPPRPERRCTSFCCSIRRPSTTLLYRAVSGVVKVGDDLGEEFFQDLAPQGPHATSTRWGENPARAGTGRRCWRHPLPGDRDPRIRGPRVRSSGGA